MFLCVIASIAYNKTPFNGKQNDLKKKYRQESKGKSSGWNYPTLGVNSAIQI